MKNYLLVLCQLLFIHYIASAQVDPPYPPPPASVLNITEAEYFIDNDPGFGLATKITVTPGIDLNSIVGTINTGALIAGAHQLGFRTLNAEGKWSITSFQQFVVNFDPPYPSPPIASTNMVRGEYFFDVDPGFGNGQAFSLPNQVDIASLIRSVDVSSLTAGSHRLYLRTLDTDGTWSITGSSQFVIDADPAYPSAPPAITNVVNAEYFFDNDPGIGNGTPITFSAGQEIADISFTANKSSLGVGNHQLYIRTLGPTSFTNITPFEVVNLVPLRLLSFTAQWKDGIVTAEALTTDEVNTDRLELQRSKDGMGYTTISTLSTKNTAGNHRYQFSDLQPLPGMSFYRLKMIDKDASFSLSRIVSIEVKEFKKPTIFPNPVIDIVRIQLPADGKAQINIYAMNGQEIFRQSQQVRGGKLELRLPTLPKGAHILKIALDGQNWTLPFIKQ